MGKVGKMGLDGGKQKQVEKLKIQIIFKKRKQEEFPILGFLNHESLFLSAKWKLESNLFFPK